MLSDWFSAALQTSRKCGRYIIILVENMNLFGVFSFGSLIKTFLPGLILFFVMLMYLELTVFYIFDDTCVFKFLIDKVLFFTILSIPVSIILGIILNTVVFSGMSDWLIEDRHKRNNAEFYNLQKSIMEKMNIKVSKKFDLSDKDSSVFKNTIDPRYFFLHKKPLENLMYLRESYWYYMEFQLNTLVAICISLPALIWGIFLFYSNGILTSSSALCVLFVIVLTLFLIGSLFIKAAIYNLDSHRKKDLSLLAGTIFFELSEYE